MHPFSTPFGAGRRADGRARVPTVPRLQPAAVLAILAAAAAAEPPSTDVFVSGRNGYHTFRIPSVTATEGGTLVAAAEGRRENRGDPGSGDINLVYKRSEDGGRSWSELKVLDDPGDGWAASNPTGVFDRSRDRLWLFYNRWMPDRGTREAQPGTRHNQAWARYSDDGGKTWSDPIDLTAVARDVDAWGAMFFGPGSGVQADSGRLVVPAARKPGDASLDKMRAYVIYSDDHGKTWERGSLVGAPTNENQVTELPDGRLLMDARQNSGDHRYVATSGDEGETWSDPMAGLTVTPVATAIQRFDPAGEAGPWWLWTGPKGPGRKTLVLRVSDDGAKRFSEARVLSTDRAAYSDMARLGGGAVGVLWERGVDRQYQFITFTRLGKPLIAKTLKSGDGS